MRFSKSPRMSKGMVMLSDPTYENIELNMKVFDPEGEERQDATLFDKQ